MPFKNCPAKGHVERLGKFQYIASISVFKGRRRHAIELKAEDPIQAKDLAEQFCISNRIILEPVCIPPEVEVAFKKECIGFIHDEDANFLASRMPFLKRRIA